MMTWPSSVGVGYEQVLGEGRTIRCGYVFAQNPIPNSTLTPFIQDILEHSFSVGYGWLWNGWEADVAYMFSFSGQQTVDKSDFLGGDFDHSENEARTHCVALSLMRKY
jgi:long-subunit fatty acid transport protein